MRFRLGFVANSSSSTFVVALPYKPTSWEELHAWMFPDEEPAFSDYGEDISPEQVSRRVWKALPDENGVLPESLTLEEMLEKIRHGYFPGCPDDDHDRPPSYPWVREVWDAYWKKRDALIRVEAAKCRDNFIASVAPGSYFFSIGFSDEDGAFEATMEHGDIFHNLPYLDISHH